MPTLRQKMLLFTQTKVAYLLNDNFKDTVAAGAVNGTLATPVGGARTVTDTNSKLGIGSGVLSFATGGVGDGNPGIWYPSSARMAGRTVLALNANISAGTVSAGFDINTAGAIGELSNAIIWDAANNKFTTASAPDFTGTAVDSTNYHLAVVQRATGTFMFVKGGAFTTWTLLWVNKGGTTATLYPAVVGNATTAGTVDAMRTPMAPVVITPLASDAFTRADGLLGNTGGGGSEESGGSGKAWTAQKGTWGVATNVAACSALTDSVGIATVDAGTTNVVVEVVATRSAGTSGLCLRYQSATNYIKAIHDGTNVQVIQVVNGTPSTLITGAATYVATARMIVALSGTVVRLFYNNAHIGGATTAITSGNNMGVFTDDTGATFDNFVVWARGNGGEYESAFNKFTNP